VREVARIAADIAIAKEPALDRILRTALQAPAATRYDSMRATTALTNRVIAYIDHPRQFGATEPVGLLALHLANQRGSNRSRSE